MTFTFVDAESHEPLWVTVGQEPAVPRRGDDVQFTSAIGLNGCQLWDRWTVHRVVWQERYGALQPVIYVTKVVSTDFPPPPR